MYRSNDPTVPRYCYWYSGILYKYMYRSTIILVVLLLMRVYR